jgi:hypothetical protein
MPIERRPLPREIRPLRRWLDSCPFVLWKPPFFDSPFLASQFRERLLLEVLQALGQRSKVFADISQTAIDGIQPSLVEGRPLT